MFLTFYLYTSIRFSLQVWGRNSNCSIIVKSKSFPKYSTCSSDIWQRLFLPQHSEKCRHLNFILIFDHWFNKTILFPSFSHTNLPRTPSWIFYFPNWKTEILSWNRNIQKRKTVISFLLMSKLNADFNLK